MGTFIVKVKLQDSYYVRQAQTAVSESEQSSRGRRRVTQRVSARSNIKTRAADWEPQCSYTLTHTCKELPTCNGITLPRWKNKVQTIYFFFWVTYMDEWSILKLICVHWYVRETHLTVYLHRSCFFVAFFTFVFIL